MYYTQGTDYWNWGVMDECDGDAYWIGADLSHQQAMQYYVDGQYDECVAECLSAISGFLDAYAEYHTARHYYFNPFAGVDSAGESWRIAYELCFIA
jgi:hypothetical protein